MNWKKSDIFRGDYESLNTLLHPVVEQLVLSRGLATKENIETFSTEEMVHHDPFLFSQMDKIITRINEAIDQGQPILVYGDYDADGVTGTTIFSSLLERIRCIS